MLVDDKVTFTELPRREAYGMWAVCAFEISRVGMQTRTYVVERFDLPKDLWREVPYDGDPQGRPMDRDTSGRVAWPTQGTYTLGGRYGFKELVVGLVQDTAFMGVKGDPFAQNEVIRALTDEGHGDSSSMRAILTLRCAHQQVVGLAIAIRIGPGHWQMRLVLVHDSHAKQGLAQALIDLMQRHFMRPQGGEVMTVELLHCLSSPSAIQLWVRNGCTKPPPLRKADMKLGKDGEWYRTATTRMETRSKSHSALRASLRNWTLLDRGSSFGDQADHNSSTFLFPHPL